MIGPDPAVDIASGARRLGSVSAVLVVDDVAPARAALLAWGDALATLFQDVELVVVANGVSAGVALALEALVAEVPDLTVHFLAARIDHDAAHLVGLDAALGDWLLLGAPNLERLPVLRSLINHARQGYQVISARGGGSDVAQPPLYRWLSRQYFGLYRGLTGRCVLQPAPVLRLYGRAAALFITRSAEAEMLLRSSEVAGGLPARAETVPGMAGDARRWRGWRAAVAKAVHELLSASTVPLRLASLIALASGGLSLLYSLYVVGVYLFKPDVMPGWTTLSLQLSGMMFLFSLLFALMAEYVLGIYRGLAPRRRYVVTRELRSPRRRHTERLNVVDESGAFHLGLPEAVAR